MIAEIKSRFFWRTVNPLCFRSWKIQNVREGAFLFIYSIFMDETPHFQRSALPLQVDSVGLGVDVFLQVVAEVHQHLVFNQAAPTEFKKNRIGTGRIVS